MSPGFECGVREIRGTPVVDVHLAAQGLHWRFSEECWVGGASDLPDDVRSLSVVPSSRLCHDANVFLSAAHVCRDGGETLLARILRRSL